MRRIDYPTDPKLLGVLKSDYLNAFGAAIEHYNNDGSLSKKCKEYKWAAFKKKYHKIKAFPWTFKELMLADYTTLAGIYEFYKTIALPPKAKEALASLFNYDTYETNIANFFISKADDLKLHSCFYCETAYINVYTVTGTNKKHFDVDHVLPKSECPLLALSLFNFVPSCQVCNSRIKRQIPIGKDATERAVLSPTNMNYDFENQVHFRLQPLKRGVRNFLANPTLFKVIVKAKAPYDQEVNFFHLEERYEYHKKEALRLKDLKQQYPRSATKRIASLLGKPVTKVEEDIFHKSFLSSNDRCFRKFTLDMLR